MITKRFICIALNAALCAGTAALVGCNQQPASNAAQPAPAASSAAAQTQPYTPPSADQLYQLVAPIALFPDKLVAQVLAGSTYPDQITAADNFLAQNANLQGAPLQDAVDPQAWDPSIKGLTVFPKVLDQMAQNIPWTTALGNAYVNDPTDVLNAIQVMRQRASSHGSLRSSAKLRVVDQPAAQAADYVQQPDDQDGDYYSGPNVVPVPQQTIEILPADDDTVYVPYYDPQTVYGDEVPMYPSYRYSYEPDGYSTGDMVTTGVIAFGAGIVVASLFEHSHHERPDYGWNNWGMRWDDRGDNRQGGGNWQRPAVVHNNSTYVSNSTTVVNHYTTRNINNSVNNRINSNNRNGGNGINPGGANRPMMTAPAMPAGGIARESARQPTRAMTAQPINAPNFNGTLTKGQPERFTHPQTGSAAPSTRPGDMRGNPANGAQVPNTLATHATSNRFAPQGAAHVAPNVFAPQDATRHLATHTAASDSSRRASLPVAESPQRPAFTHTQPAAMHAPAAHVATPPADESRRIQPAMTAAPNATREPMHQRAAPRMEQPEARPAPAEQRQAIMQRQAPAPRPQAAPERAAPRPEVRQEAARPQAAPHPAEAPHKAEPAKPNDHRDKKDDHQH